MLNAKCPIKRSTLRLISRSKEIRLGCFSIRRLGVDFINTIHYWQKIWRVFLKIETFRL